MANFAARVVGPGLPDRRGGVGGSLADADRFPALSEYLCLDRWEDGSARELATLNVFVQDGVLKCCLTDKANLRMAFLTGLGLVQLMESLEEGLRASSLDWRPWRPFKAKRS